MIKKQLRKHWNLYLQFFFIILVCITFSAVLHGTTFAADSSDDIFHWSRLTEITRDIQHGTFPQFDTYTGYLGLASPTFYPWLTLVPLALLRMICTPLGTFRAYMIIVGLISLNVSYWTSLEYWHRKIRALLFALFVYMTPVFTNLIIVQGEVSGMLAVALLPMVFFGWLALVQHGRWHLLAWGLILITFTHLITTVMSISALVILTISVYKRLDQKKIISIIKIISITLMATTIFWLPALILSKDNPIDFPHLMMPMNHYAYLGLSRYYMAQTLYFLLGLTNLIGIIVGFMFKKRLSYYGKRFYWFSIALLFLNIQYLPWHLIEDTPYRFIQFPYRTAVLSNIMLWLSLIPLIDKWCKRSHIIRIMTTSILVLSLIFCVISITTLKSQSYQHVQNTNDRELARQEDWTNSYLDGKAATRYCYNADYSPKTLTTYPYKDNMYKGLIGHSRDNYIYADKLREQQQKTTPVDNGVIVKNTMMAPVDVKMPLATYKGQHYEYHCNGIRIRPKGYQDSNPIFSMPMGTYKITYNAPVMNYRKIAILISILSVNLLGFVTVPKKIRYLFSKGLRKAGLK